MNQFIKIRKINRLKIIQRIKHNSYLNDKIDFFYENKNVNPSWFGIPIKILKKIKEKKRILYNLEKNGVETRPIISGNFAKQPASIKYKPSLKRKFPMTDKVYNSSFFIGLPTKKITEKYLNKLVKAFEKSI